MIPYDFTNKELCINITSSSDSALFGISMYLANNKPLELLVSISKTKVAASCLSPEADILLEGLELKYKEGKLYCYRGGVNSSVVPKFSKAIYEITTVSEIPSDAVNVPIVRG